uniref:Cyclin-like F-box n=1 Tax=Solanum tuberosum TaxID=4113 RepID=M1C7H7_SOLTU
MTIGDNFSESLIHKIFSYLSYEDAANSSLLSKTWQQAWLTQPSLKFKVEYGKGNNNRKIVDKIMERYKEEKYPIDKFELDITSSPYHHALAFPRIDNWLDIALQNGVKDVVCKVDVPSYPFPISSFLASKSLRELVLTGCDIMSLWLSTSTSDHQRMNCRSLRKLSLSNVRLDHNVLQTLNLKSLKLSHMSISQGFLEHLISTSQNLESLILDFVYGELHERFNICRSQSLKVLRIDGCKDIGEIDASNLVSFDYVGYEIPELKITNVSNQLKNSQTYLSCYSNSTDVEWFCKLRKFLSNLTSWSQVSLHIGECNDINMKDLGLHPRVAIPQVLVLDIDMRFNDVSICPNFVDVLLWSCHPKKLNLLSAVETITCFMDRLMYLKNSSHSTSDGSIPWDSQLKEVKAFKFISDNEHVEVDREDLAMMTRTEIDKFCFLLDW